MKRIFGVLAFLVSGTAFAGCASPGSDIDSESHFQCSGDDDCQDAFGRTECVSGSCEFPGNARTRLVGEPGPAADCTSEWPPTAVSFETENVDFVSGTFQGTSSNPPRMDRSGGRLSTPRMNRNGTVIVGLTQPSDDLEDPGQLIRWTGDTVSRLEQRASSR